MNAMDYVEYVSIYHDKDLNKYTDTWDAVPGLSEKLIIALLEDYAQKQDLELVWVAKASKTIYSDGEEEHFSSKAIYNSPFEEVDIYSIHPPKRFRDTANAE